MNKMVVLSLSVLLLLSSCGTYEGAGAVTGAHFGSVIGSAIGGISGGWRGSRVGTLIGLAGGAAVGAAVGAAADNADAARRTGRYEDYGGGDDRIVMPEPTAPRSYISSPASLEISNVQLVDLNQDGQLSRGEAAHVIFEIRNTSSSPIYSVQPSVTEVSGNKHVHISENILVECINPRETIRYTAQVKADNRLRNGQAVIRVAVYQAGREVRSQSRELRLQTFKR